VRTAATGRKSGVQSDARYRFERGVDPAFIRPGLDLATAMMMEAAGGKPSRARIAGAPPDAKTVIAFSFGLVEKLTGASLPEKGMRSTLERLGFAMVGKGASVRVTAPSWRPDIHGAADIVEEIVRIAGLDRVPSVPMPRLTGVARPVLTEAQRHARRARRILAGRGLVEAVSWSFIPHAVAQTFGGGKETLELANPISSDMTSMRPSLLPGLLSAIGRNRNRGVANLSLFEVGQCYRDDTPEGQFMAASGVRAGAAGLEGTGRHWSGPASQASVFDAKADATALLAGLGLDPAKAQVTRDAPAWFHPGRSAALKLGPKVTLAYFGEVAAFELFLAALPPERKKEIAKNALETFDLLPVRRDFAFVLDAHVPAGDVVRAVASADRKLIADIRVFDMFEGQNLGAGKKSLALEVTLQPREKTLTDEEIEGVAARVVAEVKKATGGEIRG
jgi:phenylalanyl-tRNA synthetase beta chain